MKLLTAIFLLTSNLIYAQNCVINNFDTLPYHFQYPGLIGKMYEAIRSTDSGRYQVMLIRSFSQMNRNEAYYVAIDSGKRIKIVALTRDSVLICKNLGKTDKYNIDFIENCNMAGCYLFSTCQNVVSSHKRIVLLFFDRLLNKCIEYSSVDGYIGEALEENKNYFFLKQLYMFVGKVFKDQGFYQIYD